MAPSTMLLTGNTLVNLMIPPPHPLNLCRFSVSPKNVRLDGTPAPPSRKQIVWMTKRQETEERIQRLREEVMEMEQKELERQSFYKDE